MVNCEASARARSDESYMGVRFFSTDSVAVLEIFLRQNRLVPSSDLVMILIEGSVGFLISAASEGIC